MNSNDSKRPCLLLVDDEPANIQVLVGLLQADYELKVATRGAAALKVCEQTPQLDLVLLDVMMPEMDGFEVCQRLRAAEATKRIPIIFLTAKLETADIVQGFEVGANDYVAKPFRPAELLARVRTHLLVRAQQVEIAEKNAELKGMLQIVCHDVANHFFLLRLSLEMAQGESTASVLEQTLPRMAVAVRNGIGLTTLVRDLRRLEDKGVKVGQVSLVETVDEALLLAEDRIRAKGLKVTKAVAPAQVVAEGCALTNSVFGNILSNAIKFSHPDSVVEISAQTEGDMVCVKFRDHGIGMPAKTLENLFDVTKSRSRKGTAGESGTGFGMPLMRKFVTQFGGKVEVSTKEKSNHPEDHGTEFKVYLKLAPPAGI